MSSGPSQGFNLTKVVTTNPFLNSLQAKRGKGGQIAPPDPFEQAYGLGGSGKGGSYTPPGYDQRMATYEAQRQALDAQAAQNLALRQNYSSPYMDNFQQFTGNYSYQQPYYMPPPQQFYSPPQQYFSPYMNQFQMAGGQFYQQPYSYQPSPYYQQGPFMQPGGRAQYFANMQRNTPPSQQYSSPYEAMANNPSMQRDFMQNLLIGQQQQNQIAQFQANQNTLLGNTAPSQVQNRYKGDYFNTTPDLSPVINTRGNDPQGYQQKTQALQSLIKGKGGYY